MTDVGKQPHGAPKINAEKVTKPYQLAAAVLVGVFSVDSLFLFAAANLTVPAWMPPLLVISAVAVTAISLVGLYRATTKHRDQMQDDLHFSKGLTTKNKEMQARLSDLKSEVEKERKLTLQRQNLMMSYLEHVTQQLPIGPEERGRLERALRDSIQAGEDRASQELSKLFIDRAADTLLSDDPNLAKLIESVVHARYANTAAAYDELVKKDVRPIDLVADLHRVATVMTAQRGVVTSPLPPVLVLATPGIVEVVLRETLLNATVYSPPQSRIEISVLPHEEWVEVKIVNGLMPGVVVSEDWLEPGRRGKDSSHQYANGAGMGLPLVSRLIRLIEGGLQLRQESEKLVLSIKFRRG
jgi:signal transduction histidine kinase